MVTVALTDLGVAAKQALLGLPGVKDRATIVALQGELGAGKTTFVQMLAKELGVTETVQSPTYVLMKKYGTTHDRFSNLIHIDAYRLEKPEEFEALKPNTFLTDPKNLICIEWPERITDVLPKPDMVIHFSAEGAGEGERAIDIL